MEIVVKFVIDVFFNDTATTEIYTLSLHDALPILADLVDEHMGDEVAQGLLALGPVIEDGAAVEPDHVGDRKSTRLNSSHANISYAVFCLKKKNEQKTYLIFQLKTFNTTHRCVAA